MNNKTRGFRTCSMLGAVLILCSVLLAGCKQTDIQVYSEPPVSKVETYRAVWVSYLEFETMNFETEETFREEITEMFDTASAAGLNTVIVQVRPFSDALYQSNIFPTSHLAAGVQGGTLLYDPLAIMVEEAHSRGLRIEAWVNPYRVQLTAEKPNKLAANNPAVLNEGWAIPANGGLYYNPALPEVRAFIVRGVAEIVENYAIDGIHFDDYFYPFPLEEPFDEMLLPEGQELAGWRRENVDSLVQEVYAAIKLINPAVQFGISPQGNRENNYTQQYSDIDKWMCTEGFVDYVMPQLYWGFGYLTANGKEQYQFEKLAAEWATLPRTQQVELHIGIGAYRIGVGDGGSNDQTEWGSGHNVADMVTCLRTINGVNGYALYRYHHLFKADNPFAVEECLHLKEVNTQE